MRKYIGLGTIKENYLYIGFLIVLLIAACALWLYDRQMRENQLNDRIFASERHHEQAFSSLVLFTGSMDALYKQQLLNRELAQWIHRPDAELNQDMYRLSLIQKEFTRLIQAQSGIDSVYLYNKSIDRILSTSFMISGLADFPHREVFDRFYEQSSRPMWVSSSVRSSNQPMPESILSFVAAVPSLIKNSSSALSYNIKEAYIRDQLLQGKPHVVWIDQNKEPLWAGSEETLRFFEANKESIFNQNQSSFLLSEHVVIQSRSGDEDWMLLTLIPLSALPDSRTVVWPYMLLLMAATVVMGLFPWLHTVYMNKKATRIVESQRTLTLLDSQTGLIADLLGGRPIPNFDEKARQYDIRLDSARFSVIVFQIDDYYHAASSLPVNERLLMNKTVFNAIKWTFALEYNAYLLNTELGKYTMLLGLDQMDDDSSDELPAPISSQIAYIQSDVRQQFGLTMCAGVSDMTSQLLEVNQCYAHAIQCLAFKSLFGKQSIIRYGQIPKRHSGGATFVAEQTQALIQDLANGRMDLVEKNLDNAIKEMLLKESSSLESLHAYFYNALSNLTKYALDHRIDLHSHFKEDLFFQLHNYEFFDEKKAYLMKICMWLHEQLNANQQRTNSTVEWIVSYIDEHYDRPISLGEIADKLSMSPSYLSAVLKSYLGIGFVDYVIRLRTQKAVKLMENDQLTIYQIAEQCGYDTTHTFIRQFKKMYHTTPNEYRKSIKREQILG